MTKIKAELSIVRRELNELYPAFDKLVQKLSLATAEWLALQGGDERKALCNVLAHTIFQLGIGLNVLHDKPITGGERPEMTDDEFIAAMSAIIQQAGDIGIDRCLKGRRGEKSDPFAN